MSDDFDSALDARASEAAPSSGDAFGDALTARANQSDTPVARTEAPKPDLLTYPQADQHTFAAGATRRVAAGITGAAGKVAGGLHGLFDLATGKGLDRAVSDIQSTSNSIGNLVQETPNPVDGEALGQEFASHPANPINWPGTVFGELGRGANATLNAVGAPPEFSGAVRDTLHEAGPLALGGLGTRSARAPPVGFDATEALNKQYAGQSIGAAASAPNLLNVTPALRERVQSVVQRGGKIDQEALARHAEAESLPVSAQLTRGQAKQDSAMMSDEFNAKGKQAEIGKRFDAQNQNLIDNIQAIREKAGPEVFSTDQVQHGDTLIQAYKSKDAAIRADISAKYQALKDANGGEFPVDGEQFVHNADAALKSNMKAPFLPAGVKSVMRELRDGEPMTFENFENLRTTLAAEARKADRAGDGNAEMAVNLVRDQLESLPMSGGSVQIKMLADQARQAAKTRFQALEADPAYKAAVNDSVAPDDFVNRFVTGGKRDNVAQMRANLSGNDVAIQTMGVAAIDALRKQAGIREDWTGNFTQAGFNKAYQGLAPKIKHLLPPEQVGQLESLGRVAQWQQRQSRGSYANNSHTFVAAAKDHVAGAAEGLANVAAKGVPIGTMTRGYFNRKAMNKELEKILEPGAGIEK